MGVNENSAVLWTLKNLNIWTEMKCRVLSTFFCGSVTEKWQQRMTTHQPKKNRNPSGLLHDNIGTWLDTLLFSYLLHFFVSTIFENTCMSVRVWTRACVVLLPHLCRALQQASSPHQETAFHFEKPRQWTQCGLRPLQSASCRTHHRTTEPVTQIVVTKEYGQNKWNGIVPTNKI